MKHVQKLLFGLALSMLILPIIAQDKPQVILKYGAQHIGKRTDPAMQQWRDNKLGQFIHFGLYSVLGGYWNGKCYEGAAEWIKVGAKIPSVEYDKLQQQFSLPKYDAKQWAHLAKEMGVKYAIITTKHHDGFCLWPTKYTDYSIKNTPFGRDLIKEYVDAYNKEGIDVFFYYSVIDWHQKDWRYSLKTSADSIAFERYKKWMIGQIDELMTNYPTVKGFWYDGTWDSSMIHSGSFTYDVEKLMRTKNPNIICGSRLRVDDNGARHLDTNGNIMGDYAQGYERSLPEEPVPNDWECVMTIPENQWGYHSNWQGHIKNADEIIDMIASATSLNGNFVLNFGPKGDGSIRKEEQKVAKEIGQWMKINGEAIYGCQRSEFKEQKWGYYTQSRSTGKVYMIVCNAPYTGELTVKVPQGTIIDKCTLLVDSNYQLNLMKSTKNEYVIKVPTKRQKHAYVIVLDIKKGDSVGKYVAPKV